MSISAENLKKQQQFIKKPHKFIKNLLTSNITYYIMDMYNCRSITIYILIPFRGGKDNDRYGKIH